MNRDDWIALLARATRPTNVDSATRRLSKVLASLSDLGAETFTTASLDWVVARIKRTPTALELRGLLQRWRVEAGVAAPIDRWPGGDDPTLDREDRIVLAVWQKHRADGFSHGRGDLRNRMTISLDIERLHHPRVFRHICHTDLEAAAIAVQHGWIVDPQPQCERTPDELEAAAATVRAALAAIADAKRAGPLYHEPSPPEPVVAFRHPGPRHATPEQLDRLNPLPGGRKRHAIATTAAASRMAGQEGSHTTTGANDDDHPPEAA